jgi:AcrR family transcriptional regulator
MERLSLPSLRAKAAQPRKQPLTPDAITDAAMAIIDEEGVDALNMRKLAERLGTGAASLYAHVANKDALLDLVYDRVVGEMLDTIPAQADPERWPEQLKQILRDQRAILESHRDMARISLARIPTGPNGLPVMERILAFLEGAGLPEELVVLAPDLMALYVDAVTYEQALFMKDVSYEELASWVEEMRSFLAAVPEEQFPTVRRLAGPLTEEGASDGSDRRFEFALEVIARGLQAMAQDEKKP